MPPLDPTRRKRVILVDDSADEAAFVRQALSRGYPAAELTVFRSGEDVLAHVEEVFSGCGAAPADFVLLDLKLPGLDGHAILRALRQRFAAGELPVVVFTSSREPADLVNAYGAGANSYVVKPLAFEEYMAVVGTAARYWLDANVALAAEEAGRA